MPIDTLLEAMRPPTPDAIEPTSGSVAALIARARSRQPERMGFEIEAGGVLSSVEFVQVTGPVWRDLTAVRPPRQGSTHDFALDYDCDAVVRAYPCESEWVNGVTIPTILVDGEPISDEQWQELSGLLEGSGLEDAATVLWAIHEGRARERAVEAQSRDVSNV